MLSSLALTSLLSHVWQTSIAQLAMYAILVFLCKQLCSYTHMQFALLQYTSIKPLGDRVLVKIKTSEAKSDGGILLPVSVQTRPQGGEIVAVGEGRSFGSNRIEISVPVFTFTQLTELSLFCISRHVCNSILVYLKF
jgi:hypothetical protein